MTTPPPPPRADVADALTPLVRRAPTWLFALLIAVGAGSAALLVMIGPALAAAAGMLLGAVRRTRARPDRVAAPRWIVVLLCLAPAAFTVGGSASPLVPVFWSALAAGLFGVGPPRSRRVLVRAGAPILTAVIAIVAASGAQGLLEHDLPRAASQVAGQVLRAPHLQPWLPLLALAWSAQAGRARWAWGLLTLAFVLAASAWGEGFTLLQAPFATLLVWVSARVAGRLRAPATREADVAVLAHAQRAAWATSVRVALLGIGITLLLASLMQRVDALPAPPVLMAGTALTGAVGAHLTAGAQRGFDRAAPWAATVLVSTAPVVVLGALFRRDPPPVVLLLCVLCAGSAVAGAFAATRLSRVDAPARPTQLTLVLLGLLACAPTVDAWSASSVDPHGVVTGLFAAVAAPCAFSLVVGTRRPSAQWLRGAVLLGSFAAGAQSLASGTLLSFVVLAPVWICVWLLAACAAVVCARARSFTAVPADHPIFVDFAAAAS